MSHNDSPVCKDINELLFPPENDPDKEDFCMTRTEAEQITEAFKDETFRKLFVEYVEEMQDPETQATYQREMRQLELERGNVVHFVNPVPGYVLKTSVNGEKKGFINICSNPLIKKATFQSVTNENAEKGSMWSIPYAQSPPREDVDKSGSFCLVYDVIFHPDTLSLARKEKALREKLEGTALDSVEKSFKVSLDKNNVKKPKLRYKGLARATAIKYKVGDTIPAVIDPVAAKNELPPQPRPSPAKRSAEGTTTEALKDSNGATTPRKVSSPIPVEKPKKNRNSNGVLLKEKTPRNSISDGNEGDDDESWTEPRYSIKYRSHVDMQDYSLDNRKWGGKSTHPDELILIVDLPLLRDSSTLDADVVEGGMYFELMSELRARYKLKLKLPYQVHGDSAKATFDKDKRKLTVSMKTVARAQAKCEKATKVLSSCSSSQQEGRYLKGAENEDEADVFDTDDNDEGLHNKEMEGGTACSLPTLPEKPIEVISNWTSSDVAIKGILKRNSGQRVRSLSESFVDKMAILRTGKDDSISLESLNEEVESDEAALSTSPTHEKSVRFNDSVQRQLYRSNSSILGQKKKNQRRNKNKRKARERANSEGSASSIDVDADDEDHGYTSSSSIVGGHHPLGNASNLQKKREAGNGGGGAAAADEDDDDDDDAHESPLSSSVDD